MIKKQSILKRFTRTNSSGNDIAINVTLQAIIEFIVLIDVIIWQVFSVDIRNKTKYKSQEFEQMKTNR